MNNSFFDGKIAENYKIVIVSFDDDYYYGQFFRTYAGGFKQFLCTFTLDLDGSASLVMQNAKYLDRQVYDDFEIGFLDSYKLELLEEKLSDLADNFSHTIFEALKKNGATIDLIAA